MIERSVVWEPSAELRMSQNGPRPSIDTNITELWSGVREELRRSVPSSAFASWLEPMRAVGIQGSSLYLDGPDQAREWFQRRYGAMALRALQVREPSIGEILLADPAPDGDRPGSSIPAGLGADLDFDRFVIGRGNRFAHSAALAVAERPGEAYNPLFIYGDPGLGKTHLLVSIANYLQRTRPDVSVVYTTAERFTGEFVSALRGRGSGAERFKERYRNVGALLIDDVQFLENKPRTEEEFFHTFNELYSSGSQIVLSSDRPPEAIELLTQRLRDRFAWGLTTKVEAADLATRTVLLRRLASERGLPVPSDEAIKQIVRAVPGNIRLLEGALTRVSALASMLGRQPSVELIQQALAMAPCDGSGPSSRQPAAGSDPTTGPSLEQIKAAVCDVLHVASADLVSKRRASRLVHARQLGMYVARTNTDMSLAEIARGFSRDHSTVLHSIRAVERRLEPGNDLHRALESVHSALHIGGEEPR